MALQELDPTWWLLHVDLDQFVAAVEIRRDPSLRGKPVIVGGNGDPTAPRQVASTASYEARAAGAKSGMPLRQAARRCPDAVFLPVDHQAYDAASAEVMDVLRGFGPVEVWGWDEAVIGITSDEPTEVAHRVRAAVLEQTQLSCAVGIGDTKERAKMATAFGKPGGVYQLSTDNWSAMMSHRDVGELWGIGPKTAGKLIAHQVITIGDLAAADHLTLAGWFGPTTGPRLKQLALGGARTVVDPTEWIPRSRSKQVTYSADLTDQDAIADQVDRLARDVAAEVFSAGRIATHVGVTVRTSTFYTRVKTGKLAQPTTDPEPVARKAQEVLGRFDIDRPIRLLGVRIDLQDLDIAAIGVNGTSSGRDHRPHG